MSEDLINLYDGPSDALGPQSIGETQDDPTFGVIDDE